MGSAFWAGSSSEVKKSVRAKKSIAEHSVTQFALEASFSELETPGKLPLLHHYL